MDQTQTGELLLDDSTAPEEALKNIQDSLKIDINPDYYKNNKEDLSPLLKADKPKPTPKLQEFMKQSGQHAASVQDEIEQMSGIERTWNSVTQGFGKKADTITDVHERTLKKLFSSSEFTEDDEMQLYEKYDSLQKFPQYVDPTDTLGSLPAEVATQLGVISNLTKDNAKTIAGATAFGALIGGGLGAFAAPVTGGGSIAAGVKWGGGLGLSLSSQGTLALNGAMLTATGVYNDVIYDPNSPTDLDPEAVKYVSLATGALSGGLELVGGRAVLKTIPGIKNFIGKEAVKRIVLDSGSEATKRAMIALGKAIATSGMSNALQELVTIAGENAAKNNGDLSKVSIDYILEEAAKNDRLLKSGVIGAATAATISTPATPFNILGINSEIIDTNRKLSAPNEPVQTSATPLMELPSNRAIKVLETQSKLAQVNEMEKQSKVFKGSKEVYDQFRKSIIHGTDLRIFADLDDIRDYVGDDVTKSQKVEKILGISLSDENISPVQVDPNNFFKLVNEDENFLEIFREQAKGENPKEARNYLKALENNKIKAAEILKKLNVEGLSEKEAKKLKKELADLPDPIVENPYSDESYINRPTFTKAVADLFGEKSVEDVTLDITDIRKDIADAAMKAKDEKINRVVSIDEQIRLDEQFDQEMSRLKNDQKYDIVDKFTAYKPGDFIPKVKGTSQLINPDAILKNHTKTGYSPFAIDPATLPNDLKYFTKNPRLKDYKTFVKGGITVDDAAALLGYRTGKRLLNDLVNTPTREELATKRTDLVAAKIKADSQAEFGPKKADYLEVFSNNAKNNLKDMNRLLKVKTNTAKKVIKTFAKRTPKIEDIQFRADRIVKNLKISELNPAKFEAGMNKSRRVSIDSVLDGDLFKASKALEQGALNAEAAKQAYKAVRKVNAAFKFIASLRKEENMAVVLKAGPLYEKAVNEILGTFNFDPSRVDSVERDSYANYVSEMIDRGEGDFQIPDRHSDVRTSVEDLTVEQVLSLSEALKVVVHQAKYKNKLKSKYNIQNMVMSLNSVSQVVSEKLTKRGDYNPANLTPYEKGNTFDNFKKKVNTFFAMHRRVESIVRGILDKGEANGFFTKLFWEPLNNARNEKQVSINEINNVVKKFKDEYGAKDFERINATVHEIPEFGNKTFSKGELLMMLANMGNEGNVEVAKRFGADESTIFTVLERHLDDRDAKIVQKILDTYEFGLKPKVQEFLKRTDGVEPEWVDAKPFTFKGKEYRGGYFPLFYESDSLVQTQVELQGLGTQKQITNFFEKYYHAKTMTKNGHLISREGSKAKLDLSMGNLTKGFENVLHDIHFRNPLRDVSLMLGDEKIQKDVVSVIGLENYDQMKLWLMEVSKNGEHLAGENEKWFGKLFNDYKRSSQLQRLGLKLTTFFVQTVSMPAMFRNLAKDSNMIAASKHFGDALKIMSLNPTNFDSIVKEISKYSPEIEQRYKNMDINAETTLNRTLGVNEAKGKWNTFERFRNNVEDFSFGPLSKMSLYLNSTMWLASYKQALNGDIKTIQPGDVNAARVYANSMIRLTLEANDVMDKSQIQNTKMMSLFTEFYSQMNVLTNLYATSIGEFARKYKEANLPDADPVKSIEIKTEAFNQFANDVLFFVILPKILNDIIRGNELPGDDEEAKKYLSQAVALEPLNTVVAARDFTYPLGADYKVNVGLPIVNTATDLLNTTRALTGYVSTLSEGEVYDATNAEKKSMVKTLGFFTRLFPGDMVWQIINADIPEVVRSPFEELKNDIKDLLDNHTGLPDAAASDLKDAVVQLDALTPKNSEDPTMPEEFYPILSQIESGGKWYAKNPNSSATGLYQFTEATWDRVKNAAPELNLTDEGRYDDDMEQQEKAIRWLTEDNVKRLQQSGISPSIENVYATHFLGIGDAMKVLRASDEKLVSELVNDRVIEANSFMRGMTVGDFKLWLQEKTNNAIEEIDKSQQ